MFKGIIFWVIVLLALVIVLLIAVRAVLRLLGAGDPPSIPVLDRPPRVVVPGSPLQPSPAPPPPPLKPTPLQLRVIDAPHLKAKDFASERTRGDFGELITDIVLTSDGWKKLSSKTSSGAGIGGIYVREVKGGGGFEALAVDTKTNEVAYSPAAMSDAALENALSALYAEGAFGRSINEAIAKELIRGLRNGPPFFRKELWRHNLSNGVTAVTQLGSAGELKGSTMRSHARLIEGVFAGLQQIDRNAVYLAGRALDDEPS